MLPIGGRPVLEHLVDLVHEFEVTDIAINLHYRPEVIVNHFGDGSAFGVHVTYSHEPALLGSAGAAKQLEWFLDETFFVIYGDVLANVDLGRLLELHRRHWAVATLALYEVPDPSRCGIVQLAPDGRIERFVEKPTEDVGNLANAGIYVVEPAVLRYIPAGQPCDFGHDLFPLLLELGQPMYAELGQGYILDMGSLERYEQAEADYQAGRVGRGLGSRV